MAAMMFGLVWIGAALAIGELAVRFLPEPVWDKLLRALWGVDRDV